MLHMYISSLGFLPSSRCKGPLFLPSHCCALSLSFPYPSSIIQVHVLLSRSFSVPFHCLPLCRVTSSNVPYPVLLPCSDCVHQRSFLFSISFSTSFVLYSIQLILSILLHIHISKVSIRLTSSL